MTQTALTRAAHELTQIERYSDALAAELQHQSNARSMPGGDVLVALAPVANLEAAAWHNDTAERLALASGLPWPDQQHEDVDREPPLQTLLWWTEPLRPADERRRTIRTETAILRRHLVELNSRPRFASLLADLARVRRQLENLVHAGERCERSQVPCWDSDCEKRPRLVRTYAAEPINDGYICPACHRTYDRDQYARALWQTFGHQSAERWVSLADACALLPQPERTTRAWIQLGRVTARCDVRTRRVHIWWPDLWSLWLDPPRRGRPVTSA